MARVPICEDGAAANSPYDREKYVTRGFSAHKETFDLAADPAAMHGSDALAFRGIGANTALRDAAALRQALAAYERDMVRYGFAAVRMSQRNMERFHARGVLARAATKSLFYVVDHVPPLKSAFLGR